MVSRMFRTVAHVPEYYNGLSGDAQTIRDARDGREHDTVVVAERNVGGIRMVAVRLNGIATSQTRTLGMFVDSKKRDMKSALATLWPTCVTMIRPSVPPLWKMLSPFFVNIIDLGHCELDIFGA